MRMMSISRFGSALIGFQKVTKDTDVRSLRLRLAKRSPYSEGLGLYSESSFGGTKPVFGAFIRRD